MAYYQHYYINIYEENPIKLELKWHLNPLFHALSLSCRITGNNYYYVSLLLSLCLVIYLCLSSYLSTYLYLSIHLSTYLSLSLDFLLILVISIYYHSYNLVYYISKAYAILISVYYSDTKYNVPIIRLALSFMWFCLQLIYLIYRQHARCHHLHKFASVSHRVYCFLLNIYFDMSITWW